MCGRTATRSREPRPVRSRVVTWAHAWSRVVTCGRISSWWQQPRAARSRTAALPPAARSPGHVVRVTCGHTSQILPVFEFAPHINLMWGAKVLLPTSICPIRRLRELTCGHTVTRAALPPAARRWMQVQRHQVTCAVTRYCHALSEYWDG